MESWETDMHSAGSSDSSSQAIVRFAVGHSGENRRVTTCRANLGSWVVTQFAKPETKRNTGVAGEIRRAALSSGFAEPKLVLRCAVP
jgi:hypothetical protein